MQQPHLPRLCSTLAQGRRSQRQLQARVDLADQVGLDATGGSTTRLVPPTTATTAATTATLTPLTAALTAPDPPSPLRPPQRSVHFKERSPPAPPAPQLRVPQGQGPEDQPRVPRQKRPHRPPREQPVVQQAHRRARHQRLVREGIQIRAQRRLETIPAGG